MQLIKKHKIKYIFLILSILIPLFILFIFLTSAVKAAVELLYFKAIPDDNKVFFEWKTASEDNSGFIIKKMNESGIYESLAIDGEEIFFYSNKPEGGVYTATFAICLYDGSTCEYDDDGDYIETRYFDDNVTNGISYWYKLISINNDMSEGEGETASAMPWDPTQPTWTPTGQITASPSDTSTPTSTQTDSANVTKTPTSKPTKTKKPGTPTPTKTVTRYTNTGSGSTSTTLPPNNNPPPGDMQATGAAQTAEANQVVTTTVEVQPTETLLPLPSIAIVFPTAMAKLPDEQSDNLSNNANTPKANSETWLTPQRMVMVVVIAAIWIMLGGWFYLSFKRLEK